MDDTLDMLQKALEPYPSWTYDVTVIGILLLVAWVANWVTKRVLLRGLRGALLASHIGGDHPMPLQVIPRLANVVPALVLWLGVGIVPYLPEDVVTVVRNVCGAFIILTLSLALGKTLDLANTLYERRPDAQSKPVKGYLQLLKIVVYLVAGVLVLATLMDRSPMILLSGLGAMMAVLLLVFQDTLLSLVASMQISSNDMVRVGDWIEMPQQNADGDVIDIALHTIKVQNWDKTITTIPTKKLITDSFKNWRGMSESGGRRIKRSLFLDQRSVHFLDDAERLHMHNFALLDDYLSETQKSIDAWNADLAAQGLAPVNARRVTNLGTFRAYVERYLRNHEGVNQDMTLLVRQMQPTSTGLPVEVYCFTRDIRWAFYEGVQADIFDHLLAILPEFGLRVFQDSSDAAIIATMQQLRDTPARTS